MGRDYFILSSSATFIKSVGTPNSKGKWKMQKKNRRLNIPGCMVQIIHDFHNLSPGTIQFISLYNIIKLAILLSFV